MVWRREEGIGSSGQVVGRPAVTRREISSGERGEKEVSLNLMISYFRIEEQLASNGEYGNTRYLHTPFPKGKM
jgi:hypothetical protein